MSGPISLVTPPVADALVGPSQSGEVAFPTLYTFPANTLRAASTLYLVYGGTIDNKATSGTLAIAVRIGNPASPGAATLLAAHTISSGGSALTGKSWSAYCLCTIRTVGAGGTYSSIALLRTEAPTATVASSAQAGSIDTTSANLNVFISANWATADAANIARLTTAMAYFL